MYMPSTYSFHFHFSPTHLSYFSKHSEIYVHPSGGKRIWAAHIKIVAEGLKIQNSEFWIQKSISYIYGEQAKSTN